MRLRSHDARKFLYSQSTHILYYIKVYIHIYIYAYTHIYAYTYAHLYLYIEHGTFVREKHKMNNESSKLIKGGIIMSENKPIR